MKKRNASDCNDDVDKGVHDFSTAISLVHSDSSHQTETAISYTKYFYEW